MQQEIGFGLLGCTIHVPERGIPHCAFNAPRSRFVKTDGDVGLTEGDADKAIAILQDDEDSS